MKLIFGIDSTDNIEEGGCTTYSAYRLLDFLRSKFSDIKYDLPRLIRLNPNVPWKTRGNGAVRLGFQIFSDCLDTSGKHVNSVLFDQINKIIVNFMESDSSIASASNPGYILMDENLIKTSPAVSTFFKKIYSQSLTSIVNYKEIQAFFETNSFVNLTYSGNRALVGACAALGASPAQSWSYEFLAYRKDASTPRNFHAGYICEVEKRYYPLLFNNCKSRLLFSETDQISPFLSSYSMPHNINKTGLNSKSKSEEKYLKILSVSISDLQLHKNSKLCNCNYSVPHGKDSVIFGIRGYFSKLVFELGSLILINSGINSTGGCLFLTNQHSSEHWESATTSLDEYHVFKGEIQLIDDPLTFIGGHTKVIARLAIPESKYEFFDKKENQNRQTNVTVIVFKRSGNMNLLFRKLRCGDVINVIGSVHYKENSALPSIQLESWKVVKLQSINIPYYDKCPNCHYKLTSAGKTKGVKCRKCSYSSKKAVTKKYLDRTHLFDHGWIIPEDRDSIRHLSMASEISIWPPFLKQDFNETSNNIYDFDHPVAFSSFAVNM